MAPATANDVAVIVVNFNAGEHLQHCLTALHVLPDLPGEIIVVDNASEDGSLDSAKKAFESVSYIESGANIGFAAANNLGIQSTDKPWVALVNPDAFVAVGWLSLILKAIAENPTVQFFSSELIMADDHSRLDGQGDCYHVSGLVWRRKHGEGVDAGDSTLPLFSPCAASGVYSRDAILEVGGFDEDYFCYIEDVDLGFRLRLAGYQCLHLSEAITYHVGSAITKRESDFSIYHGHRNLVWTYFKNMPTRLLWRYLPQHLLMNLVSIAYYVFKGRAKVIFKAKWHALKGLPKIIQNRNVVDKQSNIAQSMATGWLQPYFNRHD